MALRERESNFEEWVTSPKRPRVVREWAKKIVSDLGGMAWECFLGDDDGDDSVVRDVLKDGGIPPLASREIVRCVQNELKNQSKPLAIFWDFDCVPLPEAVHAAEALKRIKQSLSLFGNIVTFRVYVQFGSECKVLRDAPTRAIFEDADCEIVECLSTVGSNESVKKRIMVDAMTFACCEVAHTKGRNKKGQVESLDGGICFITGDPDIGYLARKLRRDQSVETVLVYDRKDEENVSPILCDAKLDWGKDVLHSEAEDSFDSSSDGSKVVPQAEDERSFGSDDEHSVEADTELQEHSTKQEPVDGIAHKLDLIDVWFLQMAMKEFVCKTSQAALKSLVCSGLRQQFPGRFPDHAAVTAFMSRAIAAGILLEDGCGGFKTVALSPHAGTLFTDMQEGDPNWQGEMDALCVSLHELGVFDKPVCKTLVEHHLQTIARSMFPSLNHTQAFLENAVNAKIIKKVQHGNETSFAMMSTDVTRFECVKAIVEEVAGEGQWVLAGPIDFELRRRFPNAFPSCRSAQMFVANAVKMNIGVEYESGMLRFVLPENRSIDASFIGADACNDAQIEGWSTTEQEERLDLSGDHVEIEACLGGGDQRETESCVEQSASSEAHDDDAGEPIDTSGSHNPTNRVSPVDVDETAVDEAENCLDNGLVSAEEHTIIFQPCEGTVEQTHLWTTPNKKDTKTTPDAVGATTNSDKHAREPKISPVTRTRITRLETVVRLERSESGGFPSKSLVSDVLRSRYPALFPDRASVKRCVAAAVYGGHIVEWDGGSGEKVLALVPISRSMADTDHEQAPCALPMAAADSSPSKCDDSGCAGETGEIEGQGAIDAVVEVEEQGVTKRDEDALLDVEEQGVAERDEEAAVEAEEQGVAERYEDVVVEAKEQEWTERDEDVVVERGAERDEDAAIEERYEDAVIGGAEDGSESTAVWEDSSMWEEQLDNNEVLGVNAGHNDTDAPPFEEAATSIANASYEVACDDRTTWAVETMGSNNDVADEEDAACGGFDDAAADTKNLSKTQQCFSPSAQVTEQDAEAHFASLSNAEGLEVGDAGNRDFKQEQPATPGRSNEANQTPTISYRDALKTETTSIFSQRVACLKSVVARELAENNGVAPLSSLVATFLQRENAQVFPDQRYVEEFLMTAIDTGIIVSFKSSTSEGSGGDRIMLARSEEEEETVDGTNPPPTPAPITPLLSKRIACMKRITRREVHKNGRNPASKSLVGSCMKHEHKQLFSDQPSVRECFAAAIERGVIVESGYGGERRIHVVPGIKLPVAEVPDAASVSQSSSSSVVLGPQRAMQPPRTMVMVPQHPATLTTKPTQAHTTCMRKVIKSEFSKNGGIAPMKSKITWILLNRHSSLFPDVQSVRKCYRAASKAKQIEEFGSGAKTKVMIV